jgi:predicted nuclease of predicted toxin-antitoxin system
MRFLLDANMPRSAEAVLRQFEHEIESAWEAGLHAAPDREIAKRARQRQAVIVTRDLNFSDIRWYPPESYAGIVVLRLPDGSTAIEILRILERFLAAAELLAALPKRLAIVERDRVRFYPALT